MFLILKRQNRVRIVSYVRVDTNRRIVHIAPMWDDEKTLVVKPYYVPRMDDKPMENKKS